MIIGYVLSEEEQAVISLERVRSDEVMSTHNSANTINTA